LGRSRSPNGAQAHQVRDIHCVTKWSKLDTPWDGVLVDDVLAAAGIEPPTKLEPPLARHWSNDLRRRRILDARLRGHDNVDGRDRTGHDAPLRFMIRDANAATS
jgi:hypothetical protein